MRATQPRPYWLSISGLVIGVIALGLACLPAIAFEQPLPSPFVKPAEPKAVVAPEPPPEREGGITLRTKSFTVTLGGKLKKSEEAAPPPPAPEPPVKVTSDPVRWFTISAIGVALCGVLVASIGHWRERHTPLTAGAIGCCALAITWQYVAVGIAIGVAVVVIVLLLSVLGSMFA